VEEYVCSKFWSFIIQVDFNTFAAQHMMMNSKLVSM
jgi:hypothetical protein